MAAHCQLQAVPSLGHQGVAVLLGLLLGREKFSQIRPEVFVLVLRVSGSIGKTHGSAVGCFLSNLRDLGVERIVPVGMVIARVKIPRFAFGNKVGQG